MNYMDVLVFTTSGPGVVRVSTTHGLPTIYVVDRMQAQRSMVSDTRTRERIFYHLHWYIGPISILSDWRGWSSTNVLIAREVEHLRMPVYVEAGVEVKY